MVIYEMCDGRFFCITVTAEPFRRFRFCRVAEALTNLHGSLYDAYATLGPRPIHNENNL